MQCDIHVDVQYDVKKKKCIQVISSEFQQQGFSCTAASLPQLTPILSLSQSGVNSNRYVVISPEVRAGSLTSLPLSNDRKLQISVL